MEGCGRAVYEGEKANISSIVQGRRKSKLISSRKNLQQY